MVATAQRGRSVGLREIKRFKYFLDVFLRVQANRPASTDAGKQQHGENRTATGNARVRPQGLHVTAHGENLTSADNRT